MEERKVGRIDLWCWGSTWRDKPENTGNLVGKD